MSFVPPTPTWDEVLLDATLMAKTINEAEVADIERRLNVLNFKYNRAYFYVSFWKRYLSSQGFNIETGVQDSALFTDYEGVFKSVERIATLESRVERYMKQAGKERWRSLDLKVEILDLGEQIIPLESKVLTIKQHRQEINNLVEALASALGKLSIKDSTGLSEPHQEVGIVERLSRNPFDPLVEAVTGRFGKLTI